MQLLLPIDESMRKMQGANAAYLAVYLLPLGQARKQLGDFSAAEKDLLEAEKIFTQQLETRPHHLRECRQSLVEMYDAWQQAEPKADLAAKVVHWRTVLAGMPVQDK